MPSNPPALLRVAAVTKEFPCTSVSPYSASPKVHTYVVWEPGRAFYGGGHCTKRTGGTRPLRAALMCAATYLEGAAL
jgi:hypothetical protein